MTVPATITPVESQVFTVLGGFIQQVTGLPQSSIARGQDNRVSMPGGSDFVIMTPLRQTRLSTNVTTYDDNVFEANVAGNQLNVLVATQIEGAGIQAGMQLSDHLGLLDPSTVVLSQVSGAPGGVGAYEIVPAPQSTPNEPMYAGLRADLVPTEYAMQVDVYGPRSASNSKVIEGLFYSEYGTDAFAASGLPITPLHIDEARQVGFVTGEDQWIDRWMMEVRMQWDPTVGTSQQFFPEVETTLVQAGVVEVP